MIREIRRGGNNLAFFVPEESIINYIIIKGFLPTGEIELVKNWPKMS
jgi:hypothetical protein